MRKPLLTVLQNEKTILLMERCSRAFSFRVYSYFLQHFTTMISQI